MASSSFSVEFNFGPEDQEAKAKREAKLREAMKASNEPEYLLENDRFNPDALVWLLENKCIEFRSLGKYSNLDDCDVVAPGFLLDGELGQSMFQLFDGLRSEMEEVAIPREWTNLPGSGDFGYDVLIANYGIIWSLSGIGSSTIDVECDDRYAVGVPDAFSWIARIVWRIRQAAEIHDGFNMNFSVRRFEDVDLEEKAPVFAGETRKSVSMRFDALPEINPNGPTGERPFDGGEPRSLWDDDLKWDMDYINSKEVFVERLRKTVSSFPFDVTVSGGEGFFEKDQAAERIQMLSGDLVTLRAKWDASEASRSSNAIVGIKAFNRNKEDIGYLMPYDELYDVHFEDTHGTFDPRDLGFRELACLLPHVVAVVCTPTDSDERAALKLRLFIDKRDITEDEIVAQALQTMKQPYKKRMLLSKGPLVASDLERWGAPVPDVPNPAPEGFDKPMGRRKQVCENILTISGKTQDLLPAIKRMKENVLKYIEKNNEGWFYNEDELRAANSFSEIYGAIETDIREYFAHALQQEPSASYLISGYMDVSSSVVEDGDAAHWTLSVNTLLEPFISDLDVFFSDLKSGKYSIALVSKCKSDQTAQIVNGVVNRSGGNKTSFDELLASSFALSSVEMRSRFDEMNEGGSLAEDDYVGRSLLYSINEALNGYGHKAFSED